MRRIVPDSGSEKHKVSRAGLLSPKFKWRFPRSRRVSESKIADWDACESSRAEMNNQGHLDLLALPPFHSFVHSFNPTNGVEYLASVLLLELVLSFFFSLFQERTSELARKLAHALKACLLLEKNNNNNFFLFYVFRRLEIHYVYLRFVSGEEKLEKLVSTAVVRFGLRRMQTEDFLLS